MSCKNIDTYLSLAELQDLEKNISLVLTTQFLGICGYNSPVPAPPPGRVRLISASASSHSALCVTQHPFDDWCSFQNIFPLLLPTMTSLAST